MLGRLGVKLRTLRSRLDSVGEDEPLGKPALAVVLLLDLFILLSIFDGLDAHTSQLASPEEWVPATCRDIVIDGDWTPAARLDELGQLVEWRAAVAPEVPPSRHPVCAGLYAGIEAVQADGEVREALAARRVLRRELRDQDAALAPSRGAYDTALLEATAGRGSGPAALPATVAKLQAETAVLDAGRARLAAMDAELDRAAPVAALWQAIDGIRADDRVQLAADLRAATFWFPVKRLGMELLFLLPLFAVVYFWNAAALRRRRGVQALVSTHLLLVAAVPIVIAFGDAVYDVIPKRLLVELMAVLASLKLIAVWHYLIMALVVAAGLLAVVVVQKKLFSHERLVERRIARGRCQGCGKLLAPGARACTSCGFAQLAACPGCGGLTHVHGRHCRECGRAMA